jgi:hypothetical protein
MSTKAIQPSLPSAASKRLGQLAEELRQLAPWKWMREEHVFGIEDPASGARVWLYVSSAPALCAYWGDEGFEFLQRLQSGKMDFEEERYDSTNLMLVYQEDPSFPMPGRVRPRGPGSRDPNAKLYPILVRQNEGAPAHFPNPEDPQHMACWIEQLLDLAPRVRSNPELLNPQSEEGLLLRVCPSGTWTDTRVPAPVLHKRVAPAPNRELVDRLRARCPRPSGVVEFDVFHVPLLFREKRDPRPWCPVAVLVVDADDGSILHLNLVPSRSRWHHAQLELEAWMERSGQIPAEIRVLRTAWMDSLEPLAQGLGCRLSWHRELALLAEAREDLVHHLLHGLPQQTWTVPASGLPPKQCAD